MCPSHYTHHTAIPVSLQTEKWLVLATYTQNVWVRERERQGEGGILELRTGERVV